MPITNGYCTLAEVKAACRIDTAEFDSMLERVIEGASRRVDGYCGRFFYQKTATAISLFPVNMYKVALPDLASSAITVQLDTDGNLTFETTLTASQYTLEPYDTALQGRPYRTLTAVNGTTFPVYTYPLVPTVRVTGTWGWPAVPDDVREACVILSMRQFSRFNAPLGVAGFGDLGAIAVRNIDPDVRDLLDPYVVVGVA